MKRLILFLLVLGFAQMGFAQGDIPTTKPLKVGAKNNLDVKTSNKGTSLRMPSILDENLTSKGREVKMLPDRELVQAGAGMVIDPKVGEREKKGPKKHFGDQYLGDIKTSSKFIGIVCRDHEYVDGDRVKIYLNGEVVEPNILLTSSYKGINIDLTKGFNRIDFEALNQGSSGPNTAQVIITDAAGKIIHNNRWNLSTGSKASMIVVKDGEE